MNGFLKFYENTIETLSEDNNTEIKHTKFIDFCNSVVRQAEKGKITKSQAGTIILGLVISSGYYDNLTKTGEKIISICSDLDVPDLKNEKSETVDQLFENLKKTLQKN
jgi:hypothetical protein